jgi:hypothetical protein
MFYASGSARNKPPASGNPKLPLGLLDEILRLFQLVRHRVKGPLAVMFDVNPVAAHGFNYDADLFHGVLG